MEYPQDYIELIKVICTIVIALDSQRDMLQVNIPQFISGETVSFLFKNKHISLNPYNYPSLVNSFLANRNLNLANNNEKFIIVVESILKYLEFMIEGHAFVLADITKIMTIILLTNKPSMSILRPNLKYHMRLEYIADNEGNFIDMSGPDENHFRPLVFGAGFVLNDILKKNKDNKQLCSFLVNLGCNFTKNDQLYINKSVRELNLKSITPSDWSDLVDKFHLIILPLPSLGMFILFDLSFKHGTDIIDISSDSQHPRIDNTNMNNKMPILIFDWIKPNNNMKSRVDVYLGKIKGTKRVSIKTWIQ